MSDNKRKSVRLTKETYNALTTLEITNFSKYVNNKILKDLEQMSDSCDYEEEKILNLMDIELKYQQKLRREKEKLEKNLNITQSFLDESISDYKKLEKELKEIQNLKIQKEIAQELYEDNNKNRVAAFETYIKLLLNDVIITDEQEKKLRQKANYTTLNSFKRELLKFVLNNVSSGYMINGKSLTKSDINKIKEKLI